MFPTAVNIQPFFRALVLVLALTAAPAAIADRYDGPIIDMHLHAQDRIWSPQRLCFPQPCESAGQTQAASADDVRRRTLAAMDRHGIVLGFLSGPPETVAAWVDSAPGRFIASPLIDDPADTDIDMLREGYVAGRFQGMGEIAAQYYGYAPDSPEVMAFFRLAAEFDVPAHVHTLGNGAPLPSFRVAAGDPRQLEGALVAFPDLRLFVENCGAPFVDAMTAMMYQYPQLYCDMSTLLHLTPRKYALGHLETLVERGLGKRIVFGSDQMIWPEVIPEVIEAIQSADFLSAEQKADILYHNAARFLRLSEGDIRRHHETYHARAARRADDGSAE